MPIVESQKNAGHIVFKTKDNIATMTITNPTQANALDRGVLADFHRYLDVIESDKSIRCIILTGAGKHFSSGATLDDLQQKEDKGTSGTKPPTVAETLDVMFHPVLRRLYSLEIPLITAINGVAAGIGYSFALLGDVILIGESSYLYPSFTAIGLAPDGGATSLTLLRAGLAHAFEILALAEKISSTSAVEKGLATRLCPDETLLNDAMSLALNLIQRPRDALMYIKRTLQTAHQDSYQQQIEHERISQKHLGMSTDFREGVNAFLEKRPPKFNA